MVAPGVHSTESNGNAERVTTLRRGRSLPRYAYLGERIIICAYVGGQFIDVSLGSAGGFVLSVQKVAEMVLLPFGAALLGRWRGRHEFVFFALILSAAFSFASVLGGLPVPGLAGTLLSLWLNAAAAIVLYSAVVPGSGRNNLRLIAKAWRACSVGTALIAIGQFLNLIPLITVSADQLTARSAVDGLNRGTGLKFDPNFAAMLLVIGLIFCLHARRAPRRYLELGILLGGIAATLSRMGILIALLFLILHARKSAHVSASWLARMLFRIATVAFLVTIVYLLSPMPVKAYIGQRASDIGNAVTTLVTGRAVTVAGEVNYGSGVQRADLARAAIDVASRNIWVGVGANNLPAYLGASIGVDNAAHDTYIETVAVGGMFGLGAIAYFAWLQISCWRSTKASAAFVSEDLRTMRSAVGVTQVAIALMAFVLTLDYVAFLWFPLVLGVSLRAATAEYVTHPPGAAA